MALKMSCMWGAALFLLLLCQEAHTYDVCYRTSTRTYYCDDGYYCCQGNTKCCRYGDFCYETSVTEFYCKQGYTCCYYNTRCCASGSGGGGGDNDGTAPSLRSSTIRVVLPVVMVLWILP